MHDIPLDFDAKTKTANMVVEVPRWTNAKFEINNKLLGNPITQDVKEGKVRYVRNLFPFKGYLHNYGAFPQTWEDITSMHGSLNLAGDNDPLDVVDIGGEVLESGSIVRVKILGSLALIDDGELDWKVVVVNVNDELAKKVDNLQDVEHHCPGLLDATRQWFRNYKIPDGKPANKFAFDGEYRLQEQTVDVVKENHLAWHKLVYGKVDAKKEDLPNIANTTIIDSPGYTESIEDKILTADVEDIAEIPLDVNTVFFHK